MKILIVDDEAFFRTLIHDLLDKEGYDVVTASNGKEGIEKAESFKPNLILLDALMPEISGFETCRLMKSNTKIKKIPIIMLTSLNKLGDVESAFKNGADEYITKPIDPLTFFSILNRKFKNI